MLRLVKLLQTLFSSYIQLNLNPCETGDRSNCPSALSSLLFPAPTLRYWRTLNEAHYSIKGKSVGACTDVETHSHIQVTLKQFVTRSRLILVSCGGADVSTALFNAGAGGTLFNGDLFLGQRLK